MERPQSSWLDFLDWARAPGRAVLNLDRPEYARGYLADFLTGPIDAVVPGDLIGTQVPEDTRQYNPLIEAAANPLTYAGLLPGVRKVIPKLAAQGYGKVYEALPQGGQRNLDAAKRTLGWDTYSTAQLPERKYQFDPHGYVAPEIPVLDAAGNPVMVPRTIQVRDPATGVMVDKTVYDPKTKALPAPPVTVGARDLDVEALLAQKHGIENTSSTAQLMDLQRVGKVAPAEDQALADVIDNLDWSSGKAQVLDPAHKAQMPKLDASGAIEYTSRPMLDTAGRPMLDAAGKPMFVPKMQQMDYPALVAAAKSRLRTWVSKNPGQRIDLAHADKVLDEHYAIIDRQLKEAVSKGAIGEGRAQPDYLMRRYDGLATSGVGKPREYHSAEDVVKFLADNPKLGYNRNWSERMTERANKQGRLLGRAHLREQLTDKTLGRHLLSDTGEAAGEAKRVLDETMTAIGPDTDNWARLKYELSGDVPPDAVERFMGSMNRVFKPAAVYGVGPFVRIGSIVRNQLTNYWTLAQSPEGRSYLMRDPLMGAKNLVGAFDDGVAKNLFGNRVTGSEITQSIDAVETALKSSQGMVDNTIANLRSKGLNLEADALENGVMSGFVMSEDLARASLQMRSQIDPRTWLVPGGGPIADIGSKVFGGLEQRMRYSYFVDLVKNQKKSASEAAKLVNDRFLDYAVSSAGNKKLRTYFPFAQFIVKTVPQQAKFLAATPAAIPAIAALYGGQNDLPGWARESAHVGNVLPGMAPTDVMNMIPDFTGSESFEAFQGSAAKTLGALHPVLGAGIGLASGRDTFTGNPYLEDARLPGRDPRTTERNAADTAWGLAEDTGLAMPLAGPAQQVKSLGRMEPGAAALRYLTGINTVQTDPLKAEADKLKATVAADSRVKSFERYYTKSDDEGLNAALKRLEAVRRELSQKQQQAAGLPPVVPTGPLAP